MKDSTNEKLKFMLKNKASVNVPKNMDRDFVVKFRNHRTQKQNKEIKKRWLNIGLAASALCLILVFAINYNSAPKPVGSVKDYLAYVDRNFTNDDQILASVADLDTVTYNDSELEYSDY